MSTQFSNYSLKYHTKKLVHWNGVEKYLESNSTESNYREYAVSRLDKVVAAACSSSQWKQSSTAMDGRYHYQETDWCLYNYVPDLLIEVTLQQGWPLSLVFRTQIERWQHFHSSKIVWNNKRAHYSKFCIWMLRYLD